MEYHRELATGRCRVARHSYLNIAAKGRSVHWTVHKDTVSNRDGSLDKRAGRGSAYLDTANARGSSSNLGKGKQTKPSQIVG